MWPEQFLGDIPPLPEAIPEDITNEELWSEAYQAGALGVTVYLWDYWLNGTTGKINRRYEQLQARLDWIWDLFYTTPPPVEESNEV